MLSVFKVTFKFCDKSAKRIPRLFVILNLRTTTSGRIVISDFAVSGADGGKIIKFETESLSITALIFGESTSISLTSNRINGIFAILTSARSRPTSSNESAYAGIESPYFSSTPVLTCKSHISTDAIGKVFHTVSSTRPIFTSASR